VLLAASIAAKAGERVFEAGTGAGAALLCLARRVPGISGVGCEIDPALVDLANENFEINGLAGLSCVRGDAARPGFGPVFDHVMANPPWHDATSTQSPDAKRALAHHADGSVMNAWIGGLVGCLRPRGSITLILPAAAFTEAAGCLRASKCGAVQLFPLWPRAGQAAKLVIVAAKLGGRGPDRVLPGLVLHDAAGITAAAEAVLRDGAGLAF
jgi:tRNA1(Val) A37 N6-methylase TrmN6